MDAVSGEVVGELAGPVVGEPVWSPYGLDWRVVVGREDEVVVWDVRGGTVTALGVTGQVMGWEPGQEPAVAGGAT